MLNCYLNRPPKTLLPRFMLELSSISALQFG